MPTVFAAIMKTRWELIQSSARGSYFPCTDVVWCECKLSEHGKKIPYLRLEILREIRVYGYTYLTQRHKTTTDIWDLVKTFKESNVRCLSRIINESRRLSHKDCEELSGLKWPVAFDWVKEFLL